MLAGVGLIGNALGKYISVVRESVSIQRDLADAGVRIQGSFVEVSATLADTGMTLNAFGELAGTYARVLGQNGLKGLTDFVVKTREAAGGFAQFGLTTAEATEYAAEYLDQQRRAGIFGRASEAGQARALQENIERLTAYSKILNVSRKEMQDASKKMFDNADLQAELYSMEEGPRAKAQAAFLKTSQAFAAFGPIGQEALDIFTDIAAAPVGTVSEGYQRLANAGLADLANDMLDLARANKAGTGATIEDIKAMQASIEARKDQLTMLRLSTDEGVRSTAVFASSLAQAGAESLAQQEITRKKAEAEGKTLEEYTRTAGKEIEAATRLDDAIQRAQATAEYGMVKSFATLLGGAGVNAVNLMANGLNDLTAKLRTFIDGPMTEGIQALRDGMINAIEKIQKYFGEFSDWLGGFITKLGRIGSTIGLIMSNIMGIPAAIARWIEDKTGVKIGGKKSPYEMSTGEYNLAFPKAKAQRVARLAQGEAGAATQKLAGAITSGDTSEELLAEMRVQTANLQEIARRTKETARNMSADVL